ncbi:hypothetical protein Tco_1189614 [Tanacetum coccineum]
MAKSILEYIEKAPIETNISITSNDITIEPSKEFLVKLRKNTYCGTHNEDVVEHIAKVLEMVDLIYVPDEKITTWEELVEKFFCKFYPESYDGEDSMLDEGKNWGIDPLDFLSNMNTTFKNHKKVDGRTQKKSEDPPNAESDSFFKTYNIRDVEEEFRQGELKRKNNNKDDVQPHKKISKTEKFDAVKYSLGPNEE